LIIGFGIFKSNSISLPIYSKLEFIDKYLILGGFFESTLPGAVHQKVILVRGSSLLKG
jgi:hypothetical protein